ncbi:hypothetical protein GALL_293790 [mine drainage metagenome]|uniref:Uncharacterized protein n=1 Tax=mine drainage metagenome TaxID=410659 RepID=A0A1J5RKQ1_9ZZZZ
MPGSASPWSPRAILPKLEEIQSEGVQQACFYRGLHVLAGNYLSLRIGPGMARYNQKQSRHMRMQHKYNTDPAITLYL